MNLYLTIISIFLIVLYGYSIGELFLLFKEKKYLEKIAISYGIGAGFIAIEMFIYSVLRIDWSLLNLLMPIGILAFILFVKKRNEIITIKKVKKISVIDAIFISLIAITFLYVLFESTLRPLPSWDGWSAFFLQGKAFFVDGNLNPAVAQYSGVTNPPLVSLLIAFVYKIIGTGDDRTSLLIFSVFYIATGIIFFKNIQKRVGRIMSLVFTFLLVSTPNLIRHAGNVDVGHADLVVGFYFLCSAIFIVDFIKTKSVKTLILSQLFLAFGALVKDEGVVYFLVGEAILLFHIFSIRKNYVKFLAIGFLIIGSWILFKYFTKIPQNPFFSHLPNLSRFSDIITTTTSEMMNFTRWGLLWPIGIILYFFSKMDKELKVVLMLIGIQLCAYIYIFFTTPANPVEHIHGAFDRLLLHVLPIFMYSVALAVRNLKFGFKYEV